MPKKNKTMNKKVIIIAGSIVAVVLIVIIAIIALLSGDGDDYYYYDNGGYESYDNTTDYDDTVDYGDEDSQPADGVADDDMHSLSGLYKLNCMPFSDGYAFISPYDVDPTPLYIIDKNGNICGTTSDESISLMKSGLFNDGVALLTDMQLSENTSAIVQESRLVNEKMEILISAPNDNFDNMIGITEDNVILVMKIESTVNGSTVKLGAIDTSGKFKIGLKDSKILLNTEKTVIKASYWGDGIFCVGGEYDRSSAGSIHFTNAVLFNVNTGEVFDMTSYGFSRDWGSYRDLSGEFVNGKAIITTTPQLYSSNRDLYLINTNFEIVKTIVKDYSYYEYSCYSENGYFYCESSEQHGYYNENFELVIDLSEHNILEQSNFEDGRAVIMIANPNGAKFVVAIDEKGNFLFEPIEVKDAACYYSEGLLAADLDDGKITYFDKNGKVSFTIPKEDDYSMDGDLVSCHNGVVTNGYAYYDLTGKKLF